MKVNKKLNKEINDLYTYSKLLDGPLAPRGDGAKIEVAKEIHCIISKRAEAMEKMKVENVYQYCFMAMELIEQMLLDKLKAGITVEEMEIYE